MTPFAGASAGEGHACTHLATGLMQAFDEIVRQERAITRYTDDPLDAAVLRRQPIEAGEDASQRACEIRHTIGHNGQAGIGKTLWITVGVDDDARALSRERRQHTVEDRYAADFNACFVAAAHAAREPAGED